MKPPRIRTSAGPLPLRRERRPAGGGPAPEGCRLYVRLPGRGRRLYLAPDAAALYTDAPDGAGLCLEVDR